MTLLPFFNVSHKYEAKVSTSVAYAVNIIANDEGTNLKSHRLISTRGLSLCRRSLVNLELFLVFAFFSTLHKVGQRSVWVAGVSWGQAWWQVPLSLCHVLISQRAASVTLCPTETPCHLVLF